MNCSRFCKMRKFHMEIVQIPAQIVAYWRLESRFGGSEKALVTVSLPLILSSDRLPIVPIPFLIIIFVIIRFETFS